MSKFKKNGLFSRLRAGRIGTSPMLTVLLILGGFMIIYNIVLLIYLFLCTISDIRYKKISLIQSLCFFIIGILFQIYFGSLSFHTILSLIPGIFLTLLSIVSSGHIGLGDGIMVTICGLYLGFLEVPAIMLISCFFVIMYAIILGFIKKKQLKTVPFAPFLFISCTVTSFF